MVPELPESPQAEFVTDCQVALPDASVVRTYPATDPVVRRNPENEPVPATSRRYDGVVVQIPTAPVEDTFIRRLPLPSAMMILFERFEARPMTLAPRMVLLEPVVIHEAVFDQRVVLLEPVVLVVPAAKPSAVFPEPVVLFQSANEPFAIFPYPVVLA